MSVTTRVTGRPVPSVPGGFFLIIIRKYEAEFFHLNPRKKECRQRYQASRLALRVSIHASHAVGQSQGRVKSQVELPMLCYYLECAMYNTARTIKAKTTAMDTDGTSMARFCCTQQQFESSSANRLASTPEHL